jgi:Ni,Fe-hydrogenase III component G
MIEKKKFSNSMLWWLDYSILNTNNIRFKYLLTNNVFSVSLLNFFYFMLINKKNLNALFFYNLDAVIKKNINRNTLFIAYQSIFFDFKILIDVNFSKNISSTASIYPGNSWVERELKEFNQVNVLKLNDSRKLLLNYNYNLTAQYNHYNNITNDINV